MSNVLLISAPGAGKGVSAKYLKEKYNLVHVSIGNLLREESIKDSSLKDILKEGGFVDNEIVYRLFDNFIKENQNSNYVFEGFPRLVEQIETFESILKKYNLNLDKVIYITIDENVALKRITQRLICVNCNEIYNRYLDNLNEDICRKCNGNLKIRDDDKASTYKNRYRLFKENTIPVIKYFKENYDFYEVSNNGSINDTYKQIDYIMEKGDSIDNN